ARAGTGSTWSLSSRGAWPRRTNLSQDTTLSMVDFNLIDRIGVDESEADALIREAFGDVVAEGNMDGLLKKDMEQLQVGKILKGTVVGKAGDDVVVEVGLKSEGLIHKSEFEEGYDDLEKGDVIEVLLEELEDESGVIKLSKRKADRIR